MTGVGGGRATGPCRITCSPTPLVRGPFHRATSGPRPSELASSLLLPEQPLGKIYSLRQFRHLPAQLLHAFGYLGMVLGVSAARRHGAVTQALREGSPHR